MSLPELPFQFPMSPGTYRIIHGIPCYQTIVDVTWPKDDCRWEINCIYRGYGDDVCLHYVPYNHIGDSWGGDYFKKLPLPLRDRILQRFQAVFALPPEKRGEWVKNNKEEEVVVISQSSCLGEDGYPILGSVPVPTEVPTTNIYGQKYRLTQDKDIPGLFFGEAVKDEKEKQ